MIKNKKFIKYKNLNFTEKILFFLIFIITACNQTPNPLTEQSSQSNTSSSNNTSQIDPNDEKKLATKVIFNKNFFYHNLSPNAYGCSGDAKTYLDPFTNKSVTTKPNWLLGIATDITNANVLNGPSNAFSCSLLGAYSPPPAHCASFDDGQPLKADVSKAVLIGGLGCTLQVTGCSPSAILGDIWHMTVPVDSTQLSFAAQPATIQPSSPPSANGLTWFGADYSKLDDKIYIFGGIASDNSGNTSFSNKIYKISFNNFGSAISADEISIGSAHLAGWGSPTPPIPSVSQPASVSGASFTYALRRDETMKTWNFNSNNATQTNEHQDYFLLIGGLNSSGSFSNQIYAYKPKGFSNDSSQTPPANGDFSQLYHTNTIKERTLSFNSLSSPFSTTALPFGSFQGRGYHRAIYDPTQNRFYIFGGITNSASSPQITNELWFYDPPALGRKPLQDCATSSTPNGDSIPLHSGTNGVDILNINPVTYSIKNLGVNQNYYSKTEVFPAGGCLSKVTTQTPAPQARFEHSMQFDEDQNVALIFGGCTSVSSISTAINNNNTGDPLLNCNSATLLNDTWLYFAPNIQEVRNEIPVESATDIVGAFVELNPQTKPTKRASASLFYDRAHKKYYLFGGYGCIDSNCSSLSVLNDVWEFTPPNTLTQCSRKNANCSSQGTWKLIKSHSPSDLSKPTIRKGAKLIYANPTRSYGDGYYTVQDSQCYNQGPFITSDPDVSKQYVGAIYIHIDRSQFTERENLLINLKMLPFDSNTKAPTVSDNGTPNDTYDDYDNVGENEKVIIRIQALSSPLKSEPQILSAIQPRYHEFLSSTPILGDTLSFVAGPSGQVTEKQILVPISINPSIDLIKIERVRGSVKFYEMTVSKF